MNSTFSRSFVLVSAFLAACSEKQATLGPVDPNAAPPENTWGIWFGGAALVVLLVAAPFFYNLWKAQYKWESMKRSPKEWRTALIVVGAVMTVVIALVLLFILRGSMTEREAALEAPLTAGVYVSGESLSPPWLRFSTS